MLLLKTYAACLIDNLFSNFAKKFWTPTEMRKKSKSQLTRNNISSREIEGIMFVKAFVGFLSIRLSKSEARNFGDPYWRERKRKLYYRNKCRLLAFLSVSGIVALEYSWEVENKLFYPLRVTCYEKRELHERSVYCCR